MIRKNPISFIALVFSYLFLITVSLYVSKWNDWGPQKLITWDCSGYYMYLPGFFYDNLGELRNHQYIIDQYQPCGNSLNEHISPIGKYVIKYSAGMSIMYLPGFAAGHIWANLGGYAVDGFSCPYQISMALYSLLFSFVGLWLSRILLLRYFKDIVVAATVVSIVLATNYLNYSAISSMFPHNYLFTVYAVIILTSSSWHRKYDYKRSIVLGALCGLCALSRPTDAIAILIPLFWGVGSMQFLKERIAELYKHKGAVMALFVSAVAVGSLQLIYWKIYSGRFIYWSYGDDDGLNFLKVHVFNCLFSYKKGWFVYTPFMVLSIIGFYPLFKKSIPLFWSNFVFVLVALYIVFSWKSWAYGGSFSMRAVVQYYIFLMFPLASFVEFIGEFPLFKSGTFIYFLFCTWLNLVMTYQANVGGGMESDNMSAKYFWKIFGRVHVNPNDRKFIDTDEELPADLVTKLKPLNQHYFCPDTLGTASCVSFNNEEVFLLDSTKEFLPEIQIPVEKMKSTWFRATCEVYHEIGEENPWNQPLIYLWLTDSSDIHKKEKSYRLQRIANYGRWEKFTIDILNSSSTNGNYLKVGIYNPKSRARLYVKNIMVEKAEL